MISENIASATTRKVTIKAFRFNTETDYLPSYTIEVGKDELILDLMNKIKWEHDGSFSYLRSCRHGICGTCVIRDMIIDKSDFLEKHSAIKPSRTSKS